MLRLPIVLGVLSVALAAPKSPATMTKIQVQLQSADAPAGSFAAKPKTLYRAGTQFCRIEEEPDLDHNIHAVMIINEPDFWMVNLATKSAQHGVDSGPSFNCRMPIFAGEAQKLPDDEKQLINGLEFGFELEFFKKNGATPNPGPVLQTKQTTLYKLKVGESSLALFTYGTPERPLSVAWVREEKNDIMWYSGYGEVDFDAKLFAKPQQVAIRDIAPQ